MTIEPTISRIRKRDGKRLPPALNAKQKLVSGTARRAGAQFIDACGIAGCNTEGGFHGTPMCEPHAWTVWATLDAVKGFEDEKQREYQRFIDLEEKMDREEAAKRAELEATWKTQRWIAPGYIYYLKVGDRIKIGYSKDVEQRMKQYPPMSELLATHPGTPKVEREMHHKFLHHLANGREWFTVADEIMDHVDKVHRDFAQIHAMQQ